MENSPDYVVTYQMTFARPKKKTRDYCAMRMEEFFRGSKEECLHIASHFGGGSDDSQVTTNSTVIVGPAKDWDAFLRENDTDHLDALNDM